MSVIATYTRLSSEQLSSLGSGYDWLESFEECPPEGSETIDIDKACDGIIWLLERLPGSAPASTEGDGFVLIDSLATRVRGDGGRTDLGLDAPYGPASVLSPTQTNELSRWLSEVDPSSLAAYYDPHRMDSEGVYPQIWSKEGDGALREYLLPIFISFRDFIARAASADQSVIVYFT
jgi:hypothetical protein